MFLFCFLSDLGVALPAGSLPLQEHPRGTPANGPTRKDSVRENNVRMAGSGGHSETEGEGDNGRQHHEELVLREHRHGHARAVHSRRLESE